MHYKIQNIRRKITKRIEDWEYASKIVVYDARSLNLFYHTSRFRRRIVSVVESRLFENGITVLILLNSITLACYDYNDRDNEGLNNQILNQTGIFFSICFIFECILKIITQGFIMHYNSYLRDKWNWLDFLVVIISILELLRLDFMRLRALRTFRVLRPLRSIKALPAMRKLIQSLLEALPSLYYAVVFMLQIFLLFSIFGIQ